MNNLNSIQTRAESLAVELDSITVKCESEYQLACEALKAVKQMRAQVAEAFDPIVEQAHKAHKEALNQKKKYDSKLLLAEEHIRRQISSFLTSQAALKAAPQDSTDIVPVLSQNKIDGVSTKTVWKYRIVDASLVPREFLTPDDAKIGGVVRALKENAKIAGVEVWSEETVAVRSNQ